MTMKVAERTSRWVADDDVIAARFADGATWFWDVFKESPRPIGCRVWFLPEEEGGFSAVLPELPGVASQGATLEEATVGIIEAIQGAVATYRARGQQIPWIKNDERLPADGVEHSLLVNV
jgi:predicted RNase H-like HicB family nuclease